MTEKEINDANKELSKELLIAELRNYVIEPYKEQFEGNASVQVKPNEFMKAIEVIVKLKGYDKDGGDGQDLPSVIKLKIP